MLEGVDYVSSLVARYSFVEGLCFLGPSSIPSAVQLRRAIVRMYAAALVYLLRAIDYYGQSTSGKLVVSSYASRALGDVVPSTSRS